MSKSASRAYSCYSREAAILLGQMIRIERTTARLTAGQLAERAGISRGLLQRIEQGDMGCAIGAVFEVAAIVGIRLFDLEAKGLSDKVSGTAQILSLLPQAVRPSSKDLVDDF